MGEALGADVLFAHYAVTGLSALVIFALIATPVGLIVACLALVFLAR